MHIMQTLLALLATITTCSLAIPTIPVIGGNMFDKTNDFDVVKQTMCEKMKESIVEDINGLRFSYEMMPVVVDEEMCEEAQKLAKEFSDDITENKQDLFGISEGEGKNLSCCKIQKDSADIMYETLCNDKECVKNMLCSEFTKLGVATYETDGYVYVAYLFSE